MKRADPDYFKEYYKANKERILSRVGAYGKRPEVLARNRAARAANPRRTKEYDLKKLYRLTVEEFEHMLERQAGLCLICCEPMSPGKGTHVDHDHGCCPGKKSCGKCVRGLVCGRCNTGLGQFRDSPLLLAAAADYLARSPSRS